MSSGSTGNLKRHLSKKHPCIPLNRGASTTCQNGPDSGELTVGKSGDVKSLPSNSSEKSEIRESETKSDTVASGHSFPPASSISQASLSRYVDVIKPLSVQKSRFIDLQLLKMVCKEFHPFSIVEDPEFRKFVKLLNDAYTLPSRTTLSNSLLSAVYNELVENVKAEVNEAPAICLTSDGWTSITNTGFYALTAHFIGKNTVLKSYLLECSEFTSRHTGENIAMWVDDVLSKFNIKTRITVIITDNAANMKLASTILQLEHLGCFAHTLNLVVQNAINNSIKPIVEKVKAIVHFFKKSSHAAAKLEEMQLKLGMEPLKLKQDCPTRWNSTQDMMERMMLNKEAVVSTLAILDSKRCTLDAKDWDVIALSSKILSIFYEVTMEISSEKSVSLSKSSVLVRIMREQTKVHMLNAESYLPSIQKLAKELDDGLDKRFGEREENEIIAQAILLDPRFKKQGFADECNFKSAYQAIMEKMEQFADQRSKIQLVDPKPSTTRSSIWEQFDANISKLQTIQNPAAACALELDKYLAEPFLPRTEDPLVWWESRKLIYPKLYRIMLTRLCVTATSVPCERIFSKSGQVVTEKRNRLTGKRVSQIIFVNVNDK